MRQTFRTAGWWVSAAALMAWSGVVAAQTAPAPTHGQGSCTMTDENGKTISLPECQNAPTTPRTETPASKSAAARNPFPGESEAPAAPVPQAAAETETPGTASPGTAAKRNPFPGETPASSSSSAGPLRDAGSSGESSSSSSSSESDAMKDLGPDKDDNPYKADDDAARARAAARRSKRDAPAPKPQTADERVAEDLEVASFYRDDGNWRGVYLRAKDAVATESGDPESHFLLAEAARKLGKLDEAQNEYRECLKHDPVPKTKKSAERALKEMSGAS